MRLQHRCVVEQEIAGRMELDCKCDRGHHFRYRTLMRPRMR